MPYDLQHIFRNLAQYNERANREMYETLAGLTDEERKKNAGSWFGSIHGILNHVIICDINWLKRFRVLSPDSPVLSDPQLDPPGLSWKHDLHEDFAGLRNSRTFVDERICAWFAEFPAARLGETFRYEDSAGTIRQAAAGSAFEFLFVHQTHHRGQISQVMDSLGLPNNVADNVHYLERNEIQATSPA
jgi:uncharacterized damage-inducible protein DinB